MATKYDWPAVEDRSLIGKRHNRVDGPAKARGAAKYSYDRNLEGMLFGLLVTSPVPHGRIISIDTSMAEKTPGYKGHVNIMNVGDEVQWVGTEILAICADTEEHARDAATAVNLHFEILPHLVKDEDVKKAGEANRVKPAKDDTKGPDLAAAWESADETVEGYYGLGIITHCCLEPHGQVVDWTGDDIKVYASTQAVARIPADLAKGLSRDESIGTVECRKHRGDHAVHGWRFRFEVQHRHMGHRLRPAVQEDRPAGQTDVGPRPGTDGCRRSAFRLRQRQGRGQEGRHSGRLRVRNMVDWRRRRARQSAAALRLQQRGAAGPEGPPP